MEAAAGSGGGKGGERGEPSSCSSSWLAWCTGSAPGSPRILSSHERAPSDGWNLFFSARSRMSRGTERNSGPGGPCHSNFVLLPLAEWLAHRLVRAPDTLWWLLLPGEAADIGASQRQRHKAAWSVGFYRRTTARNSWHGIDSTDFPISPAPNGATLRATIPRGATARARRPDERATWCTNGCRVWRRGTRKGTRDENVENRWRKNRGRGDSERRRPRRHHDERRRGKARHWLPQCLTVAAVRSMACIMVDLQRYTSLGTGTPDERGQRVGCEEKRRRHAGQRGKTTGTTSQENIY